MSEEFFRNGAKTYIESWPSLLFNESMATAMFQLTSEEGIEEIINGIKL